MALYFLTKPQQMIFVDLLTHNVTGAYSLVAGRNYRVYFTVQNNDPLTEATNVAVNVWHSAFGIGLPGGTDLIIQPAIIASIPPMEFGIPGQATTSFIFLAPAGGHGCLAAQILPNGAVLNQNLTVTNAPTGAPAKFSFLVYGESSPSLTLALTERVVNPDGSTRALNPGESWHPLISAPDAAIGAVSPSPAPFQLNNLGHNSYYNMALQVTVPAGAANDHVFNISGTKPGNIYVGEVDIKVTGVAPGNYVAPAPYINGGYQSADIILTDLTTHMPVPLGGIPGSTRWDTLLAPNTDYGFSAVISNASATAAVNTVVRFWAYPGGLAANGIFIDVQSVTVPASGSVTVHSAHPFHSAAPGQHICAVVSLSNAQSSMCTVDATTALHVPATIPGAHSCAAWRNTDAMLVVIGAPFHFQLGLGQFDKMLGTAPVQLNVETHIVTADWNKDPKVLLLQNKLLITQRPANALPLFMLPAMRETLVAVDLQHTLTPLNKDIKAIDGKAGISFRDGIDTAFNVNGTVPKTAKKGDVLLVRTTAHFNATDKDGGRQIEYLQVLHVTDKL